jgi:hypothetical protein
VSLNCHKCGKPLPETFKIMVGRRDTCPACGADVRCCKLCQFFDPKAYNECRESSADRVTDKEKANFCDYFKIGSPGSHPDKERQDALAKAAALFKK